MRDYLPGVSEQDGADVAVNNIVAFKLKSGHYERVLN